MGDHWRSSNRPRRQSVGFAPDATRMIGVFLKRIRTRDVSTETLRKAALPLILTDRKATRFPLSGLPVPSTLPERLLRSFRAGRRGVHSSPDPAIRRLSPRPPWAGP